MTPKEINTAVKERIAKVKGDFRQVEIRKSWAVSEQDDQPLHFWKIEVACSSGTYMRSLAKAIGVKANTAGLAWRIKRIKIGEFSL
jgi:tRNA U55 pseudouridine synthase TruB